MKINKRGTLFPLNFLPEVSFCHLIWMFMHMLIADFYILHKRSYFTFNIGMMWKYVHLCIIICWKHELCNKVKSRIYEKCYIHQWFSSFKFYIFTWEKGHYVQVDSNLLVLVSSLYVSGNLFATDRSNNHLQEGEC